jgi:hypothetical protein
MIPKNTVFGNRFLIATGFKPIIDIFAGGIFYLTPG